MFSEKQPKIEKIKKEVQLKEENIIQTVHKAKLTNKEKYSIDYSRWDNMEVTDDVVKFHSHSFLTAK